MSVLQSIADLLVLHPARVAGLGVLLLAGWRAARRPNPLWIPGVLWLVYAGWEWLVTTRSPEANIRVDLLLIWPVVGLTTLWASAVTVKRWLEAASRR